MLAAAAATGRSTHLYWLPCRGSMRGSIINDYVNVGSKFSRSCRERMNGDQGQWESELKVVAMVLLGVAWLTRVLGMRWQLRTKAVAALPGLLTLALAGAAAIGDAGLGEDSSFPWDSVGKHRCVRDRCFGRDLGVAIRGSRSRRPTPGGCAVGYDGLGASHVVATRS